MKLLIDFFPIILFFAAFKAWGIYAATAVAIAATIVQIAYLRFKHGKVETMQWVSLGVIVVFGGATLLAHDENFIKWKPTVLYWLMGAGLVYGQLSGRFGMKSLMGGQLQLPETIWKKLNYAWAAFFAVLGAVNLFVAFRFSEAVWVNFKLFGGFGLMIAFVVAQSIYLSKYIEETP